MRCWYFSEMAYHPAWEAGLARGTLRVVLPSSNFNPPTAHGLLTVWRAPRDGRDGALCIRPCLPSASASRSGRRASRSVPMWTG